MHSSRSHTVATVGIVSLVVALVALASACAESATSDASEPPATSNVIPSADGGGDAAIETDGGTEAASGTSCVQGATKCPEGTVCVAADCRVGRCEPATGGSVSARACGCNGIEYWNDSAASAAGAAIRGRRACDAQESLGCDSKKPCPALDAVCGIDVGAQNVCINGLTAGRCFGLPATCPAQDGPRVGECYGSQCTDQCALFRDKQAPVVSFFSGGSCQ